jgi:outer membrane protein assembly factor BamB
MKSPHLILLLFYLTGGAVLAAEAGRWPQFRGPTGQGISYATNLPRHWSVTSNVVWKTEIPGRGWSSPVLADGRLYLTTAIGGANTASVSLHVLCVNAIDGAIVWNVEVLQPEPGSAKTIHQKNSPASPTPIIDRDRLYVHFGHMGTAALDVAGKILWRQTGLTFSPLHGNGGSPALLGDMLVFSCDGTKDPFIVALNAGTGDVLWKTPRNTAAKKTFSFSTPLVIEVDGARQIISPGSGFVGAYDPVNGHEIWKVRYGEGYSLVPRPVFAHGLLFIGTGFDQPTVLAIKPVGARGDVTESHVAWTIRKGAPNIPSLLVVGDELYFVADSGVATCADARTGEIHWNERRGGNFSASPVYADGRIYFQNEAGAGFVVKRGTIFAMLAQNDLAERTLASYAVADNTLFIRSESHLWRLGTQAAP